MIEAKVVEDSISEDGKRITTLQVKFHRFILPEFNTHRVFSRNFSSSRAIPTKTLLKQVAEEPAMPVHWGKNQPGMQAHEELDALTKRSARASWIEAAKEASSRANILHSIGVHKQIVNRLIEPFLWAHGVVTSTEWDNWFELRAHEDAQPEIHELALQMREALYTSIPQILRDGEWHLPYTTEREREVIDIKTLRKISAARCCRVSYLKHDGTAPDINDDLALFERLAGSVPLHASPLEHQATPDEYHYTDGGYTKLGCVHPHLHGNFKGWIQHRKLWEQELYGNS
jgi:thymidylate synthase ThyX